MSSLRTFQADSMAEALSRVKQDLGEEAVILHTRKITRGGWLGIGRRQLVEITAAGSILDLPLKVQQGILARNRSPLADRPGRTDPPQAGLAAHVCALVGDAQAEGTRRQADGAAEPMLSPADTAPSQVEGRLLDEVNGLKALVLDLVRHTRRAQLPAVAPELADLYAELVENEVADELAREFMARLQREMTPAELADLRRVRERLAGYVAAMVPACTEETVASSGPRVLAFVGPTGVGKTTTVAKLAAGMALREKRRVGLITIDTYRIAAVEQLRVYADIIGVPLKMVMLPEEMPAAIHDLADRDVILIDTAGRSPWDEIKLGELKCFLAEAGPHEVHLCLSVAAGRRGLEEATEKFAALGVNRVLFTKLDEAVGFGVMLSCLTRVQARLSYFTNGQDVPHDLEVGSGRRLAELILGGVRRGRGGVPGRRPVES